MDTTLITLSFAFLGIAGIFKGIMDAISDSGLKSSEWKNKYDFSKETNHWWYFGLHTPKYSEKFPFSTTVLVFLTDKWHLAQMAMLRFIYLAISILMSQSLGYTILLSFVIFPVVLGVPFQITYNIKRK